MGSCTGLEACREPPTGCEVVLGVDPSGGRSPWGLAVLARRGGTWTLARALEARPAEAPRLLARLAAGACLCAVDAPLTPQPRGALRPCERAALRMGARLLPGWKAMERVSRAGLAAACLCAEAGAQPLEVHPGSTARILGISRGTLRPRHAAEAALAALTGALLVEGGGLAVESRECCVALPVPSEDSRRLALAVLEALKPRP